MTIPIVGLASSDPTPGNYVQVSFTQGQASNGQTDYAILLIGNCLSGSYVSSSFGSSPSAVFGPTSQDVLDTEQDAINLFGAGAELHRMFRTVKSINQSSTVMAIAVPESSGAKATGSIVVTGTATGNATLRCWIEDKQIDAGAITGDTPTVIAAALRDAINQYPELPVVASALTGTVTLTAKQKGLRGNLIRYSAKVLPGVGTGVSVTPSARTLMASGTTSDDLTSTLASISADRYYYYVPAAEDATQLGLISAQLRSMAAPIVGLRQRAIAGNNDVSPSAPETIAVGVNNERVEIVHQLGSDLSPCRIAAHMAAVYALKETALGDTSSLNFNSFGSDNATSQFWQIPSTLSGLKLSRAQVKAHLTNGVTPITQTSLGKTYLVRRITSYCLNGANQDFRVRDACKVTVADRFADDVVTQANARFAGKVIGNDPLPGQTNNDSPVVSPRDLKALILGLITQYDSANLLQDVANTIAGVDAQRETSPSTRLTARVPLKVIDILNQTGTQVNETSQG